MNILLGVTGGIAAYKSCELCSLAKKQGHDIKVIMTDNATRFIGPTTFEGLTGDKPYLNIFTDAMDHINLPKWADAIIVAPLSANSMAKIALGLCDDLLTTSILATPFETPIVLCPAMNTNMWCSPITQRNFKWLEQSKRFNFILPIEKRLACGDYGIGGLAEPIDILKK